MKKLFPIILVSFVLMLVLSTPVYAALCNESTATDPETGHVVSNGIVPCGRNVNATGVPTCRCELGHVFIIGLNVYRFIIFNIAGPLAAILIVAGGIMFIFAGGKPELASKGRQLLWGAAIGVLLILGSWIIVDVVLRAIGYTGTWSSINF